MYPYLSVTPFVSHTNPLFIIQIDLSINKTLSNENFYQSVILNKIYYNQVDANNLKVIFKHFRAILTTNKDGRETHVAHRNRLNW